MTACASFWLLVLLLLVQAPGHLGSRLEEVLDEGRTALKHFWLRLKGPWIVALWQSYNELWKIGVKGQSRWGSSLKGPPSLRGPPSRSTKQRRKQLYTGSQKKSNAHKNARTPHLVHQPTLTFPKLPWSPCILIWITSQPAHSADFNQFYQHRIIDITIIITSMIVIISIRIIVLQC